MTTTTHWRCPHAGCRNAVTAMLPVTVPPTCSAHPRVVVMVVVVDDAGEGEG